MLGLIIASSVTRLSIIPLFITGSPDALSAILRGGLLLGGEYLSMKEYGLYSQEQQRFYWAYEKGGLPLAAATHAWSNFTANILQAFLYSGVPAKRTGN